jgi:GH15 family glucan-1,4-alpha-glucosidase
VRIGNAAAGQYQLDVYGEVMSALFSAAQNQGLHSRAIWDLQTKLIEFLEGGWKQPDDGIWEVRGPRRHFTHSKVMAWVAVDRAVRTLEEWPQLDGPIDKWRALRDEIHAEVCDKGYSTAKQAFTQYYGSDELDASVLMMPLVDFLPPSDPRVVSTVEAIQRELVEDGFVLRYRTSDDGSVDGLTGREGAFLACSFWLVDCLHMIGRVDEATAMFERLLALRNDLGLLSEEYDPVAKRLVGNFPQAFSHVSLVNSACRLTDQEPLSPGHAVAATRFRNLMSDNLVGSVDSMSRTGRPKAGALQLISRLNGHRWHEDPVVAPGNGGAADPPAPVDHPTPADDANPSATPRT